MNDAILGVNAAIYITRHKLLKDHLRSQQQAVSRAVSVVLSGLLTEGPEIQDWGLTLAPPAIERTKIN